MGSQRRSFVILLAAAATTLAAQDPSRFSHDQIEQVVAPIALYPDALVTQVLMGATYPVEIVEADRWLDGKQGSDAAAIDEALMTEAWDPAVKALVKLPDVLKRMSQNLDWTRDLGDAFLDQEGDILDAIQRMRAKAKAAGNLESTNEQSVRVESDGTIVIGQAEPEVVCVPTWGTDVYGSGWAY